MKEVAVQAGSIFHKETATNSTHISNCRETASGAAAQELSTFYGKRILTTVLTTDHVTSAARLGSLDRCNVIV
jgi:hypothetical protein